MLEKEHALPDIHAEGAVIVGLDFEFRFTLVEINFSDGAAARIASESEKGDLAFRSNTDGAAIFNLNFSPTIVGSADLVAFHYGNIHGGVFVADSLPVRDLHLAFSVAETNDAHR